MNNVKLQDFVKNTLVEIANGVHEANTAFKSGEGPGFRLEHTHGSGKDAKEGIAFDIAVTASKDDKDTTGFVVSLLNLGGGAKAERVIENEHIHRIRFQVGQHMNWG